MKSLTGRVCVVTGASRGIGRSIALALGEAGATVYITGRTFDSPSHDLDRKLNCLKETAKDIENRGGKAIPIAVDHSDDTQIVGLFNRVRREQSGRLDVLVNNAFSASEFLLEDAITERTYWESSTVVRSPTEEWDMVNRVGLRNSYTCCVLATRMMIECRENNMKENTEPIVNKSTSTDNQNLLLKHQKNKLPTGIIINISSIGGTQRLFSVAFCAGKSALDRMSMEMSRDLLKRGADVVVVSLLPGLVNTETVVSSLNSGRAPLMLTSAINVGLGVSLELPGRVVAAMVDQSRRALVRQSGRCLFLSDLARKFGLKEHNQKYPTDPRSVKTLLKLAGWRRLAFFVPAFVKVPCWMVTLATSKF